MDFLIYKLYKQIDGGFFKKYSVFYSPNIDSFGIIAGNLTMYDNNYELEGLDSVLIGKLNEKLKYLDNKLLMRVGGNSFQLIGFDRPEFHYALHDTVVTFSMNESFNYCSHPAILETLVPVTSMDDVFELKKEHEKKRAGMKKKTE